jgi:hypothetical protein
LGDGAEQRMLPGPSGEGLEYAHKWYIREREWCDDALTEAKLNLICGVYQVVTDNIMAYLLAVTNPSFRLWLSDIGSLMVAVRGTLRFLPFLFYSWPLSVTIYSDFSDILLFCISLLIFSAVLLIFSTHSHIILTALAPSHLFFQQLPEVILPALIFQHFEIISH